MYAKIYLQHVHEGTDTNPDYIKKKNPNIAFIF